MSYLKVVRGELEHVPQHITDDLGFPLQNHILVVQRLNDLWLHLKEKITTMHHKVARPLLLDKYLWPFSELPSTTNCCLISIMISEWVVG